MSTAIFQSSLFDTQSTLFHSFFLYISNVFNIFNVFDVYYMFIRLYVKLARALIRLFKQLVFSSVLCWCLCVASFIFFVSLLLSPRLVHRSFSAFCECGFYATPVYDQKFDFIPFNQINVWNAYLNNNIIIERTGMTSFGCCLVHDPVTFFFYFFFFWIGEANVW